jgi:transcriptional activator of eps genes
VALLAKYFENYCGYGKGRAKRVGAEGQCGPTLGSVSGQPLHALHGWDFKLNLFPLQCSSVSAADWTEYHGQQPELANKESYRQLCRDGGRFAFIRRTVDYHRPKVIFASGVQFRSDFVDAFGFEGSPREIHIEDGNQARTLFAYERNDARGGKMTLVVSPFPGSRHGLNSNKLMEEAGKTPVAVLQCGRF